MAAHKLIVNLRGSSWDFIPNQMWTSILFRFAVPSCDGVSFDCVATPDQISSLDAFDEYQPTFLRCDAYRPFDCPLESDPQTYRQPVAVFGFDQWIAQLIGRTDFNAWNAANEGSNADELVFWSGSSVKLHAIPYEGQMYFQDLTPEERKRLLECDGEIAKHLYVV